MTRSPFWIAAIAVGLIAASCGKNFDTESQEATVTLDAGTQIEVAPLATLSPITEQAGDEFTATLAAPLMKGEEVVAPRGTTVMGVVVDAVGAEPDAEESYLTLELKEIMIASGEAVAVKTEPVRFTPKSMEPATDAPAPAVVPDDTIVTFRLAEPVEMQVAIDSTAAEPIS